MMSLGDTISCHLGRLHLGVLDMERAGPRRLWGSGQQGGSCPLHIQHCQVWTGLKSEVIILSQVRALGLGSEDLGSGGLKWIFLGMTLPIWVMKGIGE